VALNFNTSNNKEMPNHAKPTFDCFSIQFDPEKHYKSVLSRHKTGQPVSPFRCALKQGSLAGILGMAGKKTFEGEEQKKL